MNMLFILIMSLNASWALPSKTECRAESWRITRNQSLAHIGQELAKIPRGRVIQMAWGEMLRKKTSDSMALPLLQYLAGSESNQILRGYFKALLESLIRPQSATDALANWPKRPAGIKASPLKLAELCSLYAEAAN